MTPNPRKDALAILNRSLPFFFFFLVVTICASNQWDCKAKSKLKYPITPATRDNSNRIREYIAPGGTAKIARLVCSPLWNERHINTSYSNTLRGTHAKGVDH